MPRAKKPARRALTTRQTVLVVGGSGGIGRAICLAFGRAGWQIGVHARTRQRDAARTVAAVEKHGGPGLALQADIRDAKQVQEMVAHLMDRWKRLDALVFCAGQASSALVMRASLEDWMAMMAVNLTGAFHCLQASGAVMVPRRCGSIVVVGSLSSVQGQQGQAAYAAAKAGLLGLVKTAAKEWGPHNVRVNAVFPGWHKTVLSGEAFPDTLGDHALGRTPGLGEVARSIVHLEQSEDVSGQIWNFDSRIL
jgi:3-oxoacyl-[acyl-carrier protein] reductase